MSKIEEATRKKDELNMEFMNQAKESLENKMGNYEENREAIMMDMKEKLKVWILSLVFERIFSHNFSSHVPTEPIPGNRKESNNVRTTEKFESHGYR